MEPRNVNVGADAVVKKHVRDRDVGNVRLNVAAATGAHLKRHVTYQAKDHCNIVRREAPQNILFSSNLPEVEPVGIDISDLTEDTGANQIAQLCNGRMILQYVS